ncbi:SgcJ/EcaC family oxidoreductase [Phytoactinopolyspora halotolerans]|uniref:SgcJ/EcaC family oxidoreductase n=2 Tax=Phytoactinopolyspora halotolerans TaxID=1981512 RepID=A0A6L9S8V8_9ACTN|nr:SgcJ/EcaC family oxidoreductase [Phytoactinopolyspora halotolerans]
MDIRPNAESEAAIRTLIAEAEKYQNDTERFIALHSESAIIVNIAGRRVLGKDAIHHAMTEALASPLAQVLTHIEIEDIRLVTPDVAIVSATKHVSDERDADTRARPGASVPSAGSLGYVVVNEADGWRIASAQTTPIRTS